MPTDQNNHQPQQTSGSSADVDRRELVQKLGKFAIYAAPFTVLAHTHKAEAASGGGPRRTPLARP
jgi:hypothetical protein